LTMSCRSFTLKTCNTAYSNSKSLYFLLKMLSANKTESKEEHETHTIYICMHAYRVKSDSLRRKRDDRTSSYPEYYEDNHGNRSGENVMWSRVSLKREKGENQGKGNHTQNHIAYHSQCYLVVSYVTIVRVLFQTKFHSCSLFDRMQIFFTIGSSKTR
jgi:hypothetical protein